jgi:hypothetical protein
MAARRDTGTTEQEELQIAANMNVDPDVQHMVYLAAKRIYGDWSNIDSR